MQSVIGVHFLDDGDSVVECYDPIHRKTNHFTTRWSIGYDILDWLDDGGAGLIQNRFRYLTDIEREMMLTGLNEEDWNKMFGDER